MQSADDESGVVLDNLELYVGLRAKEAKKPVKGAGLCPGSFQHHFLFTWFIIIRVGYTISRAILSDAALSRGDRFLTADNTPFNLTAWGSADSQRDSKGPGSGSTLGRLILHGLPGEFSDDSAYTWFPLQTPKSMEVILGKLGTADRYDFNRPPDSTPFAIAKGREGVFHKVELLADRTLISSKKKSTGDKEKDKDLSNASSARDLPPPLPISPTVDAGILGYKKLSSLSLDPEDAVILQARVTLFQYLTGKESAKADNVFWMLRWLVERISNSSASEMGIKITLKELVSLFTSGHTSVLSLDLSSMALSTSTATCINLVGISVVIVLLYK